MIVTENSAGFREFTQDEAAYLGEVIGKYSTIPNNRFSGDVDFEIFWDTWDTLKDMYVDKDALSDKKMFYGAIKGMVNSVGDPYTVFMDPVVSEEFTNDLAGTFEGIGAEIGIKDDVLTIIAPLPEMPAEKAGLLAGDKVLAIDTVSTAGITIDEAVNNIRGPRGTEVTLAIAREGQDGIKDIVIKRDKIVIKSIRTEEKDGVYIIRITNFNDDTEKLFNNAVKEVLEKDPKGIVLDLRNNPGGYLDTAIEVSSEWVEEGIVVVEKYNEEKKIEHLARGRARLKGYPTVVLVNQGSASASEIVAGALQDYELATIIGTQTFGKGSVQTLTNLEDGSSIKVTVAKWLTPDGRSINEEGIEPNEVVEYELEDFEAGIDPQLDRALEILSNGENTQVQE